MVELATMCQWLVHHDRLRQNVQGHAGFPDLILVKRFDRGWRLTTRVIAAELKREGEEPTALQKLWLISFAGTGVQTEIWYPSSWPRIVQLLTAE